MIGLSLMHGVCVVGVGLPSSLGQPKLARVRIQCSTKVSSSRQQLLESVDKELTKGDDRAALALVKDLQGKPNGLQCFGAARQVPQRLYTLDELKLNGIEAMSLLSPVDTTLGSIERNLLIAAIVGGFAAWNVFGISQQQIFYISLGLLFLWTLDLVSFGGGLGSLVVDTIGHKFSQKYHNRVIQHEAGHFLIAYLVGILPKGYTLSSLDGMMKEGSLNIQAGTAFVDFEFLEEVGCFICSVYLMHYFYFQRLTRGKYQLQYVSALQTSNFNCFVCFNRCCADYEDKIDYVTKPCFMLLDIEQIFMYSLGRGMHRVSYIWIF
ncbi:stress regulated protein [Medicago truncatula]|uniref:Stress regulated protein n=1 Tax=Medicago truncatula TaxID=3880 RepID=A0A072U464_MEDTR|nr:stress regulated protein [Medicago truncatula]